MAFKEIFHTFVHTLQDTWSILVVAFIIYIILSFIEQKVAKLLNSKHRFSPIIAAGCGAIPQCGLTVIGADLYLKKHITTGTLIALFLACSDEALPIILSSGVENAFLITLGLVTTKVIIGAIAGYIIDTISRKTKKQVEQHLHECETDLSHTKHIGCCKHQVEESENLNFLHDHILHPMHHSSKIFMYVFIISFMFNLAVNFIGEEAISNLLNDSKYISPLIATLIGSLPNCVSSVIITELFLTNGVSFGACVAGLCMNAGIGMAYLFKSVSSAKKGLKVLGLMFGISVFTGYLICFIAGF